MSDPIPEGFLRLDTAFDSYRDELSVDLDSDIVAFQEVFKAERLIAKVQFPGEQGLKDIPAESWSTQLLAHRPFLEGEVAALSDGMWAGYRGRTVLVCKAEFRSWLQQECARFDPLRTATWTLPMAAAWLAYGTKGAVRAHWPEYLRATGRDPKANLVTTDGLVSAVRKLHERWKEGDGVPTAMNAEGEVVTMRAEDIPRLVLTFDSAYQDEWRLAESLGPVLYRAAMVQRNDVYTHPAAWRQQVSPTDVTLDPSTAWTPFHLAALWAGNGGRNGLAPDGALERGAASLFLLMHSGTLAARGVANAPGTERHGYPDDIPSWRWEGARFVFLDAEFPDRPRLVFDHVKPANTDDEHVGEFTCAFYLPSDTTARWSHIEVRTAALVAALSVDDWVEPYERPATAGRPTSLPLLFEAMERRAKAGDLEQSLGAEADWLSHWLMGEPARKGWPQMGTDSIANKIGAEFRRHRPPATK